MYRTVATALIAILMLGGQAHADLEQAAQLIEEQRYQAALDALAPQSDTRPARLLRANALAGLKHSDEAERLYRALIDEAPQDPTPYNNLAALYAASSRLQEASELLTRAMKSDERYAAVYKNLSRVYVEMSRNAYAKALRMGEPQQGLSLISLDHRAAPSAPLQLAAVETPVAAPQPTPAKSAEPQRDLDSTGAIAALQQWAAAWSAKDVEGYLAAYDVEFLPPRELSRSAWEAERRVRLKRPKQIEVGLSDFEVSRTGDNSLTV